MGKKLLQLTILSLFLGAASLKVYAYDDGDFQVWHTENQEFKVNKKSKITLEEEFRWGDNSHEFYYQHYDAGLFYNLEKWLNIGGGYRHIYELTKGKFKVENEPYLASALILTRQRFIFESRNRIEYRHFDYKADSWRYRNKFTLKFPWKFIKIEMQPYVADEIFFSFGGTNQFNQNRLSCGLGMGLTKNLKAEIYYLLQSSKSAGRWTDANVLGTKLKIAF